MDNLPPNLTGLLLGAAVFLVLELLKFIFDMMKGTSILNRIVTTENTAKACHMRLDKLECEITKLKEDRRLINRVQANIRNVANKLDIEIEEVDGF